ncbi:MAG TPA: tol-pal system protein YbgF [Alphaproteobacteria bacterium]|nr:tol-pal system protein YbgF [Alphaproteobacteria bacterium]
MVKTLQTSKTGKAGLLLTAAALAGFLLVTPATAGFAQNADTAQLLGRINQLENQIQTLSRTVYRGKAGAADAAAMAGQPVDTGAIASIDVRLSDLENKQRNMVGQLEQLSHDVRQMKAQLEKTLQDNEVRFQQMEQRGGLSGGSNSGTTMQGKLYADDTSAAAATSLGGNPNTDPANRLYDSAFSDIRESKYESAAGKLNRFMSMYPSHALAPNAQYWLAETYYVRGEYAQAARMFAQGYQDYPKGPKAGDSLLKLGLSLAQLGKKEDACLSYLQLKKEFPGVQSTVTRRADQEIKRLGCK